MKKRTFKYILPTLFVGTQAFAGTLESINAKIDTAIAKAQRNPKIAKFCQDTDNQIEEAYKTQSNSIWSQILREINESNTDGLQLGTSLSTGPLQVEFGYDARSDYFAPKKHAGQDKFNFSLGLAFSLPSFLNEENVPFGFSTKETREVSFTRLYETKCNSLVHVPYNPITRMPINANKALALEIGELVTYTAPFTISLRAGTGLELSHYRTADVEVNVFKMTNKLVRVRMVARKEKGFDFTAKAKEKIGHAIRLYEIGFQFKSSTSDTKLIDYIFDLSDESARNTYNQLIAPHDVTDFDIDSAKIKAKVALLGKSKSANTLILDEQSVLSAAQSNPAHVIRLMSADSKISAATSGAGINFLNWIRFSEQEKYADSDITRIDEQGQAIDQFFTRSIESISRSKFINLISKDKYQLGTILTDQKNQSPLGFMLLKSSNKQKLSDLSSEKWAAYLKLLPMTKGSSAQIDDKLAKLRNGGRLKTRETLFVDAEEFFKIFANGAHLSSSFVESQLDHILLSAITSRAMLTSTPSKPDLFNGGEWKNEKTEAHSNYMTYPKLWNDLSQAKQLSEYKWIYSREYNIISSAFEKLSNSNIEKTERLLAFNNLMENPLFNELGITLLSQIIPADRLANTVVYQVLLQSENAGIEPLLINYGNTKLTHYVTSQNAIMAKNFSLEPGSELRIYLRQDGNLKTKDEVVAETQLPESKK